MVKVYSTYTLYVDNDNLKKLNKIKIYNRCLFENSIHLIILAKDLDFHVEFIGLQNQHNLPNFNEK